MTRLGSPYKGLASFEDSELDALLFFGREREREIIVANLMASRLTVLYGDTGVGKSSVLHAGVARDLRVLPERLAVVVFDEWQDDPAGALDARIAEVTGAERQGRLADTLELGASVVGGQIFIILDGLEEEFLYHGSDAGPGSFLEEFSRAVTRPGLRASFLLSVREDALAKLDRFKGRIPNVFGNYLRLDHLDRAAGQEAIVGPIDRYNELAADGAVEIEPALVEAVLDQVTAGKVELGRPGQGGVEESTPSGGIETPFLQLVMSRLWDAEAEAGSHVLRLETLARLGGAEQIVRDHLDVALGALADGQQDVAAAIFNHLVTPSGTKIAHDASDLAGYLGTSPAHVAPVLSALAAERILRPVPGVRGSELPRYEIYHDILAEAVLAWRTRHESARQLERVREAAAKRHRRLLVVAAVAVVLAGAMAGVTIFAFTQRSEAQTQAARARRETELANGNATRAKAAAKRARASLVQARVSKKRADAAKKRADASAAAAKKATKQAKANLVQARAAKKLADANAAVAQKATGQATASLDQARAAKRGADANAVAAKKATKQARASLVQARAAKKRADENAQKARARELAAMALSELSTAPEGALVHALHSAQLDPTVAEAVLRKALVASRLRSILPGRGSVRAASVSPDSSLLVVGDSSGARVYRIPSGVLLRTLPVGAAVVAVAFSPDGSLVATASPNGFAILWKVATGRPLNTPLSHGGRPVRSVTFSHNGKLLATASNDKTARIWDVTTGKLALPPIQHPRAVSLVSFSADDRLLLTVDGLNARMIDVSSGQVVATMAQKDPIRTAAFSSDGKLVATGDTGTRAAAQLWAVPTGAPIGEPLVGHGGDILSVSFSLDGQLLVTASADDTAKVWSVPGRSLKAILVGHANQVVTAAFSPDSKSVVTASRDGTARIWDTGSGFSRVLLAGDRGPLTTAFFSPDGRWVASASEDGTARIWDPGTAPELKGLGSHSGSVSHVSVSSDGKLALSAGNDGTVRIWSLIGGPARTLELGGDVTSASWSVDSRLVLAASDDGAARVWRVSDGRPVAMLNHGAAIRAAAFSPDAKHVVTAGADGMARLWETAGGRPLQVLQHGGVVTDAAFSPDGSLVATAGDDGVARIWRSDDGGLIRVLRGHAGEIVALAFSPDGNWLATASVDATARIWDVHKRGSRVLRHAKALTSLAFSPDSTRLVTTSFDHDAIVWRVPDGRRLRILSGHSGVVSDAAFSFDGRWVATAGPTTAGLWQASIGPPPFLFLHGSGAQLTSVAFSPRGWRLVTGSVDGTVSTYDCKLCGALPQLVGLAKARLATLSRNLTLAQRERYLGG